MKTLPKVSVIIPFYNAEGTIKECLESIALSDYPDFEIIAVDDASSDNSASFARKFPCKLIMLGKNKGPAVARNEGVKLASGEIVAFTDSDCTVPKTWIREIARSFSENSIAAVSGGYSKPANEGTVALFQFYDTGFRQRHIPRFVDSCITANFACRRNVFNGLGGFPAKRINEDMEFGAALSANKHKILWNRSNGVSHHFENKLDAYFKEQILWAESVASAYILRPSLIFKKSTWSNEDIIPHLVFTALFYCMAIFSFFSIRFLGIFFILNAGYLVLNAHFLHFVAKNENIGLAIKSLFMLLVRNTAWLAGIMKALFKTGKNNG